MANAQVPVEILTFDKLTDLLVEIEKREHRSTLEMFWQYIREDKIHSQNEDEWFDLFFLYLGTEEVKRYGSR